MLASSWHFLPSVGSSHRTLCSPICHLRLYRTVRRRASPCKKTIYLQNRSESYFMLRISQRPRSPQTIKHWYNCWKYNHMVFFLPDLCLILCRLSWIPKKIVKSNSTMVEIFKFLLLLHSYKLYSVLKYSNMKFEIKT